MKKTQSNAFFGRTVSNLSAAATIFTVLIAVTFVNAPASFAVTDPNAAAENAQLALQQAQDQTNAQAGIQAAASQESLAPDQSAAEAEAAAAEAQSSAAAAAAAAAQAQSASAGSSSGSSSTVYVPVVTNAQLQAAESAAATAQAAAAEAQAAAAQATAAKPTSTSTTAPSNSVSTAPPTSTSTTAPSNSVSTAPPTSTSPTSNVTSAGSSQNPSTQSGAATGNVPNSNGEVLGATTQQNVYQEYYDNLKKYDDAIKQSLTGLQQSVLSLETVQNQIQDSSAKEDAALLILALFLGCLAIYQAYLIRKNSKQNRSLKLSFKKATRKKKA